MKLSVIIPCLNAADTLGEQLDALASQEFDGSWEVIIADNGSNDNPETVVDRFVDRIPGLRLIDASEQRGCAYARNRGATFAEGDALLFCDADDIVAPDWLQQIHTGLESHDFVTGPADPSGINEYVQPGKRRSKVRVWNYMPFLPHAIGGNMGIKKWIHDEIGGFDASLLSVEDIDYSWRVKLEKGIDVYFLPDAIIFYRFRPTLMGAFWQNVHNGRYTVNLYKKYHREGLIPKKSLKNGLKEWYVLLKQLPSLASAEGRARWVRQFGHAVGRLKGSIQERVLAL